MNLNPAQRRQINEALQDAFRSYDALAEVVFLHLGETLGNIAPPDALGTVRRKVIEWAESNDHVEELLAAAVETRPTNKLLQATVATFAVTGAMSPDAAPTRTAAAAAVPSTLCSRSLLSTVAPRRAFQ